MLFINVIIILPDVFQLTFLYESDVTFSPKISPYHADVLPVWANDIGPLQISNLYNFRKLASIFFTLKLLAIVIKV